MKNKSSGNEMCTINLVSNIYPYIFQTSMDFESLHLAHVQMY